MSGNTIGKIFKLTTFGESHGMGIGGVIDGCPPNIFFDKKFIQSELNRRKPGQSKIVTQRKESDSFEVFSGVFNGKTTGTPIGFFIKNENQRSKDYSHIKDLFRPSHADMTYYNKYKNVDYRGGGRSSARETAARVFGGAIAKLILSNFDIKTYAYVSCVGNIKIKNTYSYNIKDIESNVARCPDVEKAKEMINFISEVRKKGDTVGGIVSCVIDGLTMGLGEPVFDRFEARLAQYMLSINASKGFEIGSGFNGTKMYGSQHNDPIIKNGNRFITTKNNSGGVQGGITNGMPVYFNVAFKPVATIMQKQTSIDKEGNIVTVEGKGRHDPCVLPRAVPIVEAMSAMAVLDFVLLKNSYNDFK